MEALPRREPTASTRARRVVTRIVSAAALTVAAVGVSLVVAQPAQAATICEQFGTVVAGNYIIMNNRWGSSAPQCIETTANGFTITRQDGTGNLSGAPVSYPAIYLGCHYSNCSPNSPLPAQISTMGNVNTSISLTYPGSGTWDAAYDIWINADTNVSGVQDTEIMIWLNRQGSIQPIGSPVGTVTLAGRSWQVWVGSNGQNNVVSYLATSIPITNISFNVRDFILDAITRGSNFGTTSWYLTSVQAGFEPWIGGVGLTVNSFSATVGGGGPIDNPPGTPGTPTASNVTSNSVTLSWAASSGTVSSYQIERATGATSTSFTQVGTSSTTSFTDTGLSPNTTYRYRVRATNSAGASPYSSIVNVTTSQGGTGGGGCTYRIDAWDNGFVAYVRVLGPRSGWSIPFTIGPSTSIINSWNVTISGSGTNRTGSNVSYNGNIPSGQSIEWGFQGTRPSGGPLPTFPDCTAQ
ncbi:MAG: cellulose binding domain-containing protein [Micromonosporaceae bacterium]|nr:cellulose binding domain-containing protein [Micromonosporaceae bacterium]